jgi:hypothetical protein
LSRFHKRQGKAGEARKFQSDALAIFEQLATLKEPDISSKELVDLAQ